jgi:hypothetical protein
MTKALPRLIRDLTPEMGIVLLIARSERRGQKTRSLTGYMDLTGALRAHDGLYLDEHAIEPFAFIERAYDEDDVLRMLQPGTPEVYETAYCDIHEALTIIFEESGADVAFARVKALCSALPFVERTQSPVADALDAAITYIDATNRFDIPAPDAIKMLCRIFASHDLKVRPHMLASINAEYERIRTLDDHQAAALISRILAASYVLTAHTAADLIVLVCADDQISKGGTSANALRFASVCTLVDVWDRHYPGDFLDRVEDILDAEPASSAYT